MKGAFSMNTLSMPRRRARGGFTLIELVVVIVILAILAAVIVPRFFGRTDDAKISSAVTTISSIDNAISLFNADTGSFPPNLDALITNPQIKGWNGPYLKNQSSVPLDPWGHPYVYKQPGDSGRDFDIVSAGPDGKNAPIQSWNPTGAK
jgi:general secretion pathway protein G